MESLCESCQAVIDYEIAANTAGPVVRACPNCLHINRIAVSGGAPPALPDASVAAPKADLGRIPGFKERPEAPTGVRAILDKQQRLMDELAAHEREIAQKYQKPVTVMFTDIKGSTRFFEARGDIEGRMMIEQHNKLLFPVIAWFSGKVIKTVGDSIMATFLNPERAVRAAIRIQQTLEEYRKTATRPYPLHVRVGVHFGPGIVEEKDVYGDVVNTAARVESLADGDEILISEAVRARIEGERNITLRPRGETKVKGREEAVGVHQVLWRAGEMGGNALAIGDAHPADMLAASGVALPLALAVTALTGGPFIGRLTASLGALTLAGFVALFLAPRWSGAQRIAFSAAIAAGVSLVACAIASAVGGMGFSLAASLLGGAVGGLIAGAVLGALLPKWVEWRDTALSGLPSGKPMLGAAFVLPLVIMLAGALGSGSPETPATGTANAAVISPSAPTNPSVAAPEAQADPAPLPEAAPAPVEPVRVLSTETVAPGKKYPDDVVIQARVSNPADGPQRWVLRVSLFDANGDLVARRHVVDGVDQLSAEELSLVASREEIYELGKPIPLDAQEKRTVVIAFFGVRPQYDRFEVESITPEEYKAEAGD